MKSRNVSIIGASLALLGVILGAFGAHGLRGRIEPQMLITFETGVRYLIYHSLLLIILPLFENSKNGKEIARTGLITFLGIALFSGSLFLLAITSVKELGMITPIGGLLFILGWIQFIVALKRRDH